MSAIDDQKPPRLAFGMYKRFALGALLITLASSGAVATAGLLEVDELVGIVRNEGHTIPGLQGALDDVPDGKPQTILVLGSDRRFVDIKQDNPARSDTIMLVRLDPSKEATAVLSIPRDLKAAIHVPGGGVQVTKINAAYSYGGPALTVKTVRRLMGIKINHVVNVNFGGFRRAVNRLGCVYVDVDRHYFHSNAGLPASEQYAEIDIPAGYQKLCGQRSLDYVRFRHDDDDLVRSARQQDFLRQAKDQIGLGRIFGDRKELLRIFARYTDTDIHSTSATLQLLKLAFKSSGHPIREVHFGGNVGPVYVTISRGALRKVRNEFLQVKASSGERPVGSSAARSVNNATKRAARRRSHGLSAFGLASDRTRTEDYVAQASTHLRYPLYYPRVRLLRGSYIGQGPRVYSIKDTAHHRHRSYRMVISTGLVGQYYGVQGTSWKAPPILDDPSDKVRMRGRTYQLFYDGSRLRLVALRTPKAVYWVSNSLSETLSNKQMLSIARSLSRVGDR
jgi:polyisoprenyl-teichoic acid--peptidoglycan teichoic acid transferase